MAVRKEEVNHLVQQDERPRIIDDEQFQEAQQRLAGRRRGRRGPYLRSEARPFTGLIFCETCGSICYRRKSKNAKGEYHDYGCGCRHRHGDDACENAASIREDLLLQEVARTFKNLFEDADSIIEEATKEAQGLMRKNRGEVRRIGGQLAEVERKVGSLTRLLFDPDIGLAAKKAISRQIGEQEVERERLHKATSELAEEANDGTERLAAAVRLALDEARESLASAATTSELREFVARWVGPMVLKRDGTVVERTLAAEDTSEASVKGLVAGAGFVAIHNLLSPYLRRCWALPRRGRHFQTT